MSFSVKKLVKFIGLLRWAVGLTNVCCRTMRYFGHAEGRFHGTVGAG